MQKRILVFSLIGNLFFVILFGIFVTKRGGIPFLTYKLGFNSSFITPIPSPVRDQYYDQRQSLFEILPKEGDEIVFIGNSITNGCEWSELFQNSKIKNRGIVRDKTAGVLLRIDNILESKPKIIFILVGINDLTENISIESIVDNYNQIISRIRNISPITKVYIQSILPINNKFYKGIATNQTIKDLNAKLQSISNEKQLTYIDLFSHFINSEGSMDEKYSNDGLHLLGSGYLMWKSVIEKYVN
jgi:lysophospholipase L1-like esterase